MSRETNKNDVPVVPYQSMEISGPDIRSQRTLTKTTSTLKLIFDLISLILVLIIWLLLKYFVKPIRRPFLCSDLSLYHPKPPVNVFPTWLLFVCAIIIPIILILLSEGIRWFYLYRRHTARIVYQLNFRRRTCNIPEWIGNLYIIIGAFVFSNVVNSFLTNIGKVTVGRHRPHFIPSCFNKFSYQDFCVNATQWFVDYTCLGESSAIVKEKDGAYDIRQSFPSGHSSSAFCGLIFLALYIHKVWNYRNFGFLPYVFETGCFALAAYIGFTRISDNRHHPTDVLAGAILGSFIAVIAFRYVIRSLRQAIIVEPNGEINSTIVP